MSLDSYRLFHDLSFIGMAVTSPVSKRWLQVNGTLCGMLGYSAEELAGTTWEALTHPDDLAAEIVEFDRIVRGESSGYTRDKRFLRSDGETLYTTIDVKAVRAASGTLELLVATMADITARVIAERAAREAALLLRNLGRQIPGVIYQFQMFPDGRTCFPFANEAFDDIFEMSRDDVRFDATPAFSRVHPDDVKRVHESIAESARNLETWHCDYRLVLPKQGVRWLTGNARPERLSDGSTLWHGFIADSTEQQLAREALRESEERFRIQVEHAPEAIVVYDTESERFLDANKNAEELFGLSRSDLLQRGVRDVSSERQEEGVFTPYSGLTYTQRAMQGEAPVFEWNHLHSSGREVPCEVRLVRLPYAGRQLVRGSLTDISSRKQALDTLRRLQAAIDSSVNGVAMASLDGRLSYVNRAFLDLWGFSEQSQVLGREIASFWKSQEESARVLSALHSDGAWSGEMTALRPDGTLRMLRVNASEFRDSRNQRAGTLASFADITSESRLQAQLLQAQKMESVGRLAGGIAHDFNNLLTVMKGYLELSISSLDPLSAVRQDLIEVDRAADSASSLTQQLLAFSRKQIISPIVLDLNEVVRRIHGMLQRILGEDVLLHVVTDAHLSLVRFDPGQAEQVLVNLAVNARDAMPDGGQLTLETSNIRIDAEYCEEHPGMTAGDHVLLAVSDTGVGMTADIREHAFEPFFTTKEAGRGTGLGLAMIHGAVMQNGGRVEVYSETGVGTSFKIYLPAVAEKKSETPEGTASPSPRGQECILLVEDDSTVRALAARLLKRQGYRVFDFASGLDALAWLRDTPESVQLLLTDVIMPAMNGRVLAEQVASMRPDVRVLFVSGYTANVIVQHGVLKPGVEFLAKPFTIAALAQRVRDVLDGTSG